MRNDSDNNQKVYTKPDFRLSSDFVPKVGSQYFGARVRFMRDSLQLNQKQLAIKVGISKTSVQNYEKGLLPTGNILSRLAEVYGCSVSWLLTGQDDAAPANEVQPSAPPEPASLPAEHIPAEADELRPGGPVEGFQVAVEMLSDIFHSRDKVLIDTAISVLTTLSARCGRKPHHYNKEE